MEVERSRGMVGRGGRDMERRKVEGVEHREGPWVGGEGERGGGGEGGRGGSRGGGEGDGRAGKQQDGVIDIMTCGCMNHSTTEYIDSM